MAKALLFDLDGTLVDTAPDLAAALHRLQAELGQPLTPFEQLRPLVSQGARGMLRGGFGLSPDAPDYAPLAQRFLAHYAQALCVHSVLFPGMEPLLRTLESRGIPWGIVTNKVERLARPLIDALGLTARAACIVGGDTAPRAKPHPDPLLHACAQAGLQPAHCLYVGDDIRDIQAGRAAGMGTVAAAYGYLGCDEPLAHWNADHTIHHPSELLALIDTDNHKT